MGAASLSAPHLSVSNVAAPRRKRRTYNVRRIKATWPYTVHEIAELFSVHKNAVMRWLQQGLQADRSQRPFLIRGEELAGFLNQQQNGMRRKCAPNEFFCFRCRVPREACLGIADVSIESPTRLRVTALCAVCETRVNKIQRVSRPSENRGAVQRPRTDGRTLDRAFRPQAEQ